MVREQGIDISYHNGAVNWAQVKTSGVAFAMIRVGYGSSDGTRFTKDTRFDENMQGALDAGMHVGVYVYSYAKSAQAARLEAKSAAALLSPWRQALRYPVAYDLEDTSQKTLSGDVLTDMVLAFAEQIEAEGFYPMLYSNPDWLKNRLQYARLAHIDIWIAHWNVGRPGFDGDIGVWQYSATGQCAGVQGRVDLNLSYVDYPSRINPSADMPDSAPAPVPDSEQNVAPDACAARFGVCTGTTVNLRAGPGTGHVVLGVVRKGEAMLYQPSETEGWHMAAVSLAGKIVFGYVAATYVEAM